jgi:protein TonB
MGSYSGTADRPDKAKAIGAVVAVHAALAFIILSGLNVRMIRETVDRMKTFNVEQPPPPPPRQPPPKREAMKREAGAPAKKAEATPVVAPRPKLPVPSPIVASPIAGTGSAAHPGAGTSGNGTGAGGIGTGLGGGGYGDYSRFTPARIVRGIPNSEYRRISAGRIPRGTAAIAFRVDPNGTMSNCHVVRSSGDPYVDSMVCEAATRNMRFEPARDPTGRPVAQDMTFVPNWRPSY